MSAITGDRLANFCDAARAKQQWEVKILGDRQQIDPGVKWAMEAGLLQRKISVDEADSLDEGEQQVIETILELQREAQRVRTADNAIRLNPSASGTRNAYDWSRLNLVTLGANRFIRSARFAITPARLKEDIGAFVADDIIPAALHQVLSQELDALARTEPKDWHPGSHGKVQDVIHPSLYPYVINHTPLDSAVEKSSHPMLGDQPTFKSLMRHIFFSEDNSSEIQYESKYAWIPSIFRISPDASDVRIQSYINGLGPRERHPELYRVIEKIFALVLPVLENTVTFQHVWKDSPSVKRWSERYNFRLEATCPILLRSDWEALLKRQAMKKTLELSRQSMDERERELWRARERDRKHLPSLAKEPFFGGKDLKIIVKAANYVLKPGETYHGTWHMEGLPHERIVASAIYYYDTAPSIVDQGLGFRRLQSHEHDFPGLYAYRHEDFLYRLADTQEEIDNLMAKSAYGDDDSDSSGWEDADYPSDWEDMSSNSVNINVDLGSIPTQIRPITSTSTGRLVTFPNWVQRRVLGLENTGDSIAERKILCFFLVNDTHAPISSSISKDYMGTTIIRYPTHHYQVPTHTVLTTSHVPYQAQWCNLPTLYFLLPRISERLTGRTMLPEIIEHIIRIGGGHGPKGVEDIREGMGIDRRTAEQRRREVITDRKARLTEERQLWEQTYSLCEH